ncbi:hypothetical protein GCM10023093_07870 [Nemorincola caseinilytica]|uniref:Glycosyltransferase 2-like domain-containing protein n=1 Tax=Nemorincola caseinilytica TaxID=2054315 RepID=A0ABP8N980_9BACT
MKKIKRYLHYINTFIRSSEKGVIIRDLYKEVRHKGLTMGVQSFLHLKAGYFFPGYDVTSDFDPIFSIRRKQKHLMISLPVAMAPKVTVIIPLNNEVEHVYYCIRSIVEKAIYTNYEVIVVDDGSERGSELLSMHIQNLVVVRNDKRIGHTKSLNQAVKRARGDMYLFLGHDTLVRKGWMQEMLHTFEKHEQTGIVGAKHLNADNTLKEAGGIVWQDASVWGYGSGDDPEKAEYNYVRDADHVSGSAMMVSKEAWEKTGGFDEGYSESFCEDTDLCFEARKNGFRVLYQPTSVVVHFEEARSGRNMSEQTKKLLVADRQRFRDKWQAELKTRTKKGKRIQQVRSKDMAYRSVLIIDQDLPAPDRNPAWKNVNELVDLLLDMKYKVTFLSTYSHQSQQTVEQLQQRGVEVLMGDRQDHVKENMQYYEAVLMCRIAASMPYMILLRNNNYKGTVINYGRELSHLKVDREIVIKRDLVFDLQSKLLKAQEDFVYAHADHSLMVSWEEIEYLRTYISKQLHYIPPYHFDIKERVNGFEKREGILMVGEGNYIPDQDAMKWLLKMYEPLHEKGIALTIAAANTPSFIFDHKKRYKLLNIVTDTAPDSLQELYAKTRLVVAPMRIGAGMKGRVVEAMANGVPVAGTFLAFEGIPKDNSFVYAGHNSEKELAQAIEDIYSNAAQWQQLSAAGMAYARKNFDGASLKETLTNILGNTGK